MHVHHYLQLGVSSEAVFKLKSPNWEKSQLLRSFLIPSDKAHQLHLSGQERVLMIWLDPEFQSTRSLLHVDDIQLSLHELEEQLKGFSEQKLNCQVAGEIRDIVTGIPSLIEPRKIDHRLSSAIDWVNQNLVEQSITAEQLAETVYLSSSRFMHLFSEQIGIPVRKYILWQRLRHALLQLAEGVSITESAHAAGFTDSSHMNRTFNAMFGITPSKIFKNSRFIQVLAC